MYERAVLPFVDSLLHIPCHAQDKRWPLPLHLQSETRHLHHHPDYHCITITIIVIIAVVVVVVMTGNFIFNAEIIIIVFLTTGRPLKYESHVFHKQTDKQQN